MKENEKKALKSSLIGAAVICALFVMLRGVSRGWQLDRVVWIDGITISGMLLVIWGFFCAIHRKGYLDWVDYLMYATRFVFSRERDRAFMNFPDYQESMTRGSGPLRPGLCLGAGLVLLGAIGAMLC